MARRVFDLRGVSDEEAEAVRAALDDAGVAYYEKPWGYGGRSALAIWVVTDDDRRRARETIGRLQTCS